MRPSQRSASTALLAFLFGGGGRQTPAAPVFNLLPCNLPAFELFQAVVTQWQHGPAGPTGLNYLGVRLSPAFRRIPRDQRDDVFADVCVMERAWLEQLGRQRASSMNSDC